MKNHLSGLIGQIDSQITSAKQAYDEAIAAIRNAESRGQTVAEKLSQFRAAKEALIRTAATFTTED